MAGGIRVPFIVHAPALLKEAGTPRRQWIHVIDVLPRCCNSPAPRATATFNGLRTRPMDGHSFAAMLADAQAPQQRQRQYYELQANRGYISCGGEGERPGAVWKIVSLQAPRQPMQLNNWMLFNLALDPAELNDLAAQHPDTLARLVAEFEADATANYVYPLDHRDDLRAITLPPFDLAHAATARDFYPAAQLGASRRRVAFDGRPQLRPERALQLEPRRRRGGAGHWRPLLWCQPVCGPRLPALRLPVVVQPGGAGTGAAAAGGAGVCAGTYRALGERKGLGQVRLKRAGGAGRRRPVAHHRAHPLRRPDAGAEPPRGHQHALCRPGACSATPAALNARASNRGRRRRAHRWWWTKQRCRRAMRANFQKSQQAAQKVGGGVR